MTSPWRPLILWLAGALALIALGPAPAVAHESQPGLLELRQLTVDPSQQTWEVIWRAPIYYGQPHPARLQLPAAWQAVAEPTVQRLPSSELHRQMVRIAPDSLDGSVIAFPGLEQTITDVFVRVTRLDGTEAAQVVRPTKPEAVLRGERPWTESAGEYLVLGFHHILLGVDHRLFVLGLLIIVRGPRQLIETITAFTVAHSITLALATLGYAGIPTPPLNAAIALSILFLGPEIVRVWRGQTSFTIRHPWVVAFGFGLLHGFGFASGLSTVGMPRAEIPLALLMFNIGVELGQLTFVALILLLHRAVQVLEFRWPRWAELGPAYLIGTLGAYWDHPAYGDDAVAAMITIDSYREAPSVSALGDLWFSESTSPSGSTIDVTSIRAPIPIPIPIPMAIPMPMPTAIPTSQSVLRALL